MNQITRASLCAMAIEVVLVGAGNLQSTVGTFECKAYRNGHVIDRFRSENSLWKTWLHAIATDEAAGPGGPDVDHIFVGYDADAKRWNIIGIDSSGSHWTRHSNSAAYDGSRWVDDYPPDGGRATIHVLEGGARYTFDLTAPTQTGASSFSHTICSRMKDKV